MGDLGWVSLVEGLGKLGKKSLLVSVDRVEGRRSELLRCVGGRLVVRLVGGVGRRGGLKESVGADVDLVVLPIESDVRRRSWVVWLVVLSRGMGVVVVCRRVDRVGDVDEGHSESGREGG